MFDFMRTDFVTNITWQPTPDTVTNITSFVTNITVANSTMPVIGQTGDDTLSVMFVNFVDRHKELFLWYTMLLILMLISNILAYFLMKMESLKYNVSRVKAKSTKSVFWAKHNRNTTTLPCFMTF